jgi:hypothetical protein
MPFVVEPEAGETIILEAEYAACEKSEPFAFGITNQAIFLPAKKTFPMKDPWYFRRVPLSDVREVRIRRLKPHVLTILGICIVPSDSTPVSRCSTRTICGPAAR